MGLEWFDFDTRVGVYGIATRAGDGGPEILLTLWNEPDPPQWTLPGGGVEYGEHLDDGLRREFHEETGLAVTSGSIRTIQQLFIEPEHRYQRNGDRPLHTVAIVYDVTVTGGVLGTTEVGGTTAEARWLPVADLDQLPHVALVGRIRPLLS